MERIFEIYIRTTPEKLWEAITTSDTRRHYTFGNGFETDWQVGSPIVMTNPNAPGPLSEGTILEADPPRRFVHTMTALWEPAVEAEGETRVTWEIEQVGDSCRLTVVHDELPDSANAELYGGWPMILSGLKTLLETGEHLTTPGSLMYAQG